MINKLLSERKYDGLIIYEVDGIVSAEMQFVGFDTVMVFIDNKLNVLYLDRQSINLETVEFDFDRVKIKLLDGVSERFVEKLIDFDLLEKKN